MNEIIRRKLLWPFVLFVAIVLLSIMVLAPGTGAAPGSGAAPLAQTTETPAPEATAAAVDDASPTPNAVDYVMYFYSQPKDADECALAVQDGQLVVAETVSNPGMSCPDMFSWKLLIEAIQGEFWRNWAADQYTWPEEPLPLCSADAGDQSNCCTVGSQTNPGYDDADNPGLHCPYFPGDQLAAGDEPNVLESKPPAIAQDSHFTEPVPPDPDPGRVIRQEMAELVFRNKPMFDYVFANNIYHTNGLADVFARNAASLADGAPYRQRSAPGELLTIDFPIQAVMIKTNWLHEERAAQLGLVDNPENPYITMELNSAVTDNNGTIFEPGLHYLVALHVTSKDIPNWIWATFEHVDNPGRCDDIGCNDSFGYLTPDPVAPDQYTNYTAPYTMSDNLLIPSIIFDTGQTYPGGERTSMLETIFEALDIGTTEQVTGSLPAITDSGWLSYRLKGSQSDFTDSTGRPALLGNSVTEAGFVNTSSCMTCHGRAAVTAEGTAALGVFISELDDGGYPQSVNGAPDPNWYYTSNSKSELTALQTDFTWGIFFANPLTSTVSAEGYQPLDTSACAALADTLADATGVSVTEDQAIFQDYVSGQSGSGCQATARGTGAEFESPGAVAAEVGEALTAAGWEEDAQYAAAGPTGAADGYRMGDDLCLLQVGWAPAEDADCSTDEPISACQLEPEQQLYIATLNCAQSMSTAGE